MFPLDQKCIVAVNNVERTISFGLRLSEQNRGGEIVIRRGGGQRKKQKTKSKKTMIHYF